MHRSPVRCQQYVFALTVKQVHAGARKTGVCTSCFFGLLRMGTNRCKQLVEIGADRCTHVQASLHLFAAGLHHACGANRPAVCATCTALGCLHLCPTRLHQWSPVCTTVCTAVCTSLFVASSGSTPFGACAWVNIQGLLDNMT